MADTAVDVDFATKWIRRFADVVTDNAATLTDLDAAVGDGDHGTNMQRGVTAVVTALDGATWPDLGALFKKVGMTLVSAVGGASGPLYGTFFLRMGSSLGGHDRADAREFARALRAGLDGLVERGRAEAGEKTMFDALSPAIDALDAALDNDATLEAALRDAATAADDGRDATTAMIARKGRASYLGQRSVGHLDPGATSAAMLINAAADQESAP